MNAPHPYTRQVGDYDNLAAHSNEVLAQLVQRLKRHTQGEVLAQALGTYRAQAS